MCKSIMTQYVKMSDLKRILSVRCVNPIVTDVGRANPTVRALEAANSHATPHDMHSIISNSIISGMSCFEFRALL